jgi:hypothetical protein
MVDMVRVESRRQVERRLRVRVALSSPSPLCIIGNSVIIVVDIVIIIAKYFVLMLLQLLWEHTAGPR